MTASRNGRPERAARFFSQEIALDAERRKLAKIAAQIESRIQPSRAIPPIDTWAVEYHSTQVKAKAALYSRLAQQGRRYAAKWVRGDVENWTQALQDSAAALLNSIESARSQRNRDHLSAKEIYQELLALSENPTFQLNCGRAPEISVNTDSIEIEGVELGRFTICLNYRTMKYKVFALDPNPCAADEQVTHPHVRGDYLCEGGGSHYIEGALNTGCIAQFFDIVDDLLHNYNDSSPFHSIYNWESTPCEDCGESGEDIWRCGSCSHEACSNCMGHCDSCSDPYCYNCMYQCDWCSTSQCSGCNDRVPAECCDRRLCSDCQRYCDECEGLFCPYHFGSDMCPDCKEKEDDESDTEVQSDSVGEAPVSP